MKILAAQPKLVELVQEAILAEIASGKLPPGARVIQEQLAQELGVSRQPVQQALLLLRNLGVLREAPGRGLQVAPLDLEHVRNMYDVRAVIEGLAFRKAAERNPQRAAAEGPAYIAAGREAVAAGDVARMIQADMAFHAFVYELSRNPLVAPAMDTHWANTQRVMGEVLMRDERPRDIWDQHEALLHALMEGDGRKAEKLAREHIQQAADFMIDRLQREAAPA
ncbi:GntR family transcriptional regulator [Ramlibacter rhizophilus]|uniref:GntR family transcriptional regulator n=1 Tax=Ramlibacter rhizophilus TaxID=1781167 RepID=A0A4Z0BZR3_9BURK|nr:GntR family transcriptional regulator [Ramlibacter rhizophilus]TFZ03449.1 GntR family transcriptional regulator [Ramlibacter rhizophilus]